MYKVKATRDLNIFVKDLGLTITDDSFEYIPKREFESSANIASLLKANFISATKIADVDHPDYDINHNYAAIVAPAVTDDINKGYSVGSQWIDTVTDKVYICTDNTKGTAVWKELTSAA